MFDIVLVIAPLFGLIAVGYVAGRIFALPEEGLAWLNTFLVYVALPALFFRLVAGTPVDQLASPAFFTTTTGVTLLVFLVALWIAMRASGERLAPGTIQAFGAAYGNVGYMGPAVAIAAFGPVASAPVALIVCFDNVLHFVMAPLCMALGGKREGGIASLVITILRRIFTHPFIVATLLGAAVAIFSVPVPPVVDRFVELLANAAAPAALFSMGVLLALRPLRKAPGALSGVVALKLLGHPLLMWIALSAVGDFPKVWIQTAVLMAGLPTAANVFIIAQHYGVWVERASATILLTTLGSVLTIPLVLFALEGDKLPLDLF